MSLTDRIEHFSASAIGTYLKCPTQWYFRYIEGIKSPPSVALVTGSSVDDAANTNDKAKIESHEDLPEADLLDVTRDSFKTRSEDIDWSLEEDAPGEAVDTAIGLTKVWRKELAPTVQPIEVQRKIDIMHPTWILPILGYVDTDSVLNIIDRKTAAKRKNQADLETDVQSAIYLLEAHERFSAQTFQWHVMVKNKTPVTQVVEREKFDPAHTVRFVGHMQKVIAQAVESGLFGACSPDNWACSPKFCGWWSICPHSSK